MSLLDISNLFVNYNTDAGCVRAVTDVSITIDEQETLGLVGETGAGKTTLALSILRLLPPVTGDIAKGSIVFDGQDLTSLPEKDIRKIRGNQISMIFQDPMTALNPIETVCDQVAEVICNHRDISKSDARREALKMLERVGIKANRGNEYPHQFSGGMKQRVVIAIALACNPRLLIADEPTTALDVTIQAQVLQMIDRLKKEQNMAVLLITHDLGVVANACDKVAIMYAGEIVEYGSLEHIFDHMGHPYTKGLFDSLPVLDKEIHRLQPIEGLMPDPVDLPSGCKFAPRCSRYTLECDAQIPALKQVSPGHLVRCLHCEEGAYRD